MTESVVADGNTSFDIKMLKIEENKTTSSVEYVIVTEKIQEEVK